VLSRNGKEFTATGEANVMAGSEIKVVTERTSLPISVTQLEAGSWVIFQLPGFTTAASGDAQTSLDALRKASTTSYFKDKDALWVKLVAGAPAGGRGIGFGGPGGSANIQVSR
jgi:cell migration-inducing and hyaluronan-binding protein